VSSLSFGSGISVIFLFTGSPDRVSTLSSPGTRPGIRPVIRDREPGGASHHIPVSCCLTCPGAWCQAPLFGERSTPGPGRGVGGLSETGLRAGARPYFGPRLGGLAPGSATRCSMG
jgi:hypothetical protein